MNNVIIKEMSKLNNFKEILDLYSDAIQIKASLKKKSDDKQSLLKYDKWIQEELYSIVYVRKEPHITKQELVDIMKWKLSRGKWRPRLVQLAESNTCHSVEEASTKAITLGKLNKTGPAIQKLCELKGVGPATASAILAICVPEKFGFFADEVAGVLLNGKPSYTLNEYLQINEALSSIAECLNIKESSDREKNWTPHKVELAIWTYVLIKEHDSSLLPRSK